MTRREEIEKAAFNYINSDAVSAENMQFAFGDFINGAEWADKTMIEKACQWLENRHNIEKCLNVLTSRTEDLSKAFRQAMKGE